MLCGLVAPLAHAAPVKNTLEVSGWMPYWRAASSTENTRANLHNLTTVHPFAFYVSAEGELKDNLGVGAEPWRSFVETAQAQGVRVVPTIMWNDGAAMHRVLGDPKLREQFVDDVVELVEKNGWDGIDIDFESKLAETKDHFSALLRELSHALGTKLLYCTIESRTPLSSRYDTVPANIEYANDYKEIDKHCDRVQVMAYDQGTIDLKLNRTAGGPYAPVADVRWVEKVMREAMKTISPRKLVIGIPTYGYEYQVEPLPNNRFQYTRLWAFNPGYATELMGKLGLTAKRNGAGELQLLYLPQMLGEGAPTADSSANNLGVPATALSNLATAPSVRPVFNIASWSDAQAVEDKIRLAKKLGLRGVAIFKFDGGQDQKIWDVLAGN